MIARYWRNLDYRKLYRNRLDRLDKEPKYEPSKFMVAGDGYYKDGEEVKFVDMIPDLKECRTEDQINTKGKI